MTLKALDAHWQVCGKFPIKCPHCGQTVVRASLDKHIKSDCLMIEERCPFAFCGCDFKNQRRHLQKHNAMEVAKHLDMLFESHQHLKDEKHHLEEQVQELKSKLDQLELKNEQCNKEMKLLKEFCTISNNVDTESEESDTLSETNEDENTVLVGNFPSTVNEHMVRSLLGQYGRHASVIYHSKIKLAVVKYYDKRSAENLIEKYKADGIKIHGCYLVCVNHHCIDYPPGIPV